jgi:hypothetical protein
LFSLSAAAISTAITTIAAATTTTTTTSTAVHQVDFAYCLLKLNVITIQLFGDSFRFHPHFKKGKEA